MYRTFTAEGYRGFERLELDGLRRLNLFVGPNNAGKSSALEAVFLHGCGPNLATFLPGVLQSRTGGFDGAFDVAEALLQLFRRGTAEPRFTLTAEVEAFAGSPEFSMQKWARPLFQSPKAKAAKAEFSYLLEPASPVAALFRDRPVVPTEQPPSVVNVGGVAIAAPEQIARWTFQTNGFREQTWIYSNGLVNVAFPPFCHGSWIDSVSHRSRKVAVELFNYLDRADRGGEVAALVTQLFPEVTGIRQLPFPNGARGNLYLRTPSGEHEVSAFGEGLRRWLTILVHLLRYRGMVLCVDEIDAGLHPYLEAGITRQLLTLLKERDIQLFAATHNMEFLDVLLQSAYEGQEKPEPDQDPIAIYTLRRDEKGGHSVRRRTGWYAREARAEVRAELRA